MMAETGERQSFDTALMILIQSTIRLPEGLMEKVSEIVREYKMYYSNADFIVEAIRRRIDDLEDIFRYIPISSQDYEELDKALEETAAPYRNSVDYIQSKISEELSNYREWKETNKTQRL
jgi:Arc/MetJ-type ribon-helix-helix transcriptional regulator